MDLSDICLHDDAKKLSSLLSSNRELKTQINKRNAQGYTALHLACYAGRHQVVKTLMENGADPNLKVFSNYN